MGKRCTKAQHIQWTSCALLLVTLMLSGCATSFLKNRFTGDTGIACDLIYNKETGRLTEGEFDE